MILTKEPLSSMNLQPMPTALPLSTTGKKITSRVMNIPDKLWNTPPGLSSCRRKRIRNLRSQRENLNEDCLAVAHLLTGPVLGARKNHGRKLVEPAQTARAGRAMDGREPVSRSCHRYFTY
jgi:hypothetical protein